MHKFDQIISHKWIILIHWLYVFVKYYVGINFSGLQIPPSEQIFISQINLKVGPVSLSVI